MNGERDEARARDESRIVRSDWTGVAPDAEIVLGEPLDLAALVEEPATDMTPFTEMAPEELHEIRGLTVSRRAASNIGETQPGSSLTSESDGWSLQDLQYLE